MGKAKRTDWVKYKKGEANCYSWKLIRVQIKITDNHYINNFIDYVTHENRELLRNIDKIILVGNGNPIAIFPKTPEELSEICVYLESVKDTDINTIILSMAEDSGVLVNSDLIEDVLAEVNSVTRMEVRYLLED